MRYFASLCKQSRSRKELMYQMELQTLFEMEDTAVSAFKYHVASSVPDFQTKLADSRPARLLLICRFKNGGGER
jgi:hypothetical protein